MVTPLIINYVLYVTAIDHGHSLFRHCAKLESPDGAITAGLVDSSAPPTNMS